MTAPLTLDDAAIERVREMIAYSAELKARLDWQFGSMGTSNLTRQLTEELDGMWMAMGSQVPSLLAAIDARDARIRELEAALREVGR